MTVLSWVLLIILTLVIIALIRGVDRKENKISDETIKQKVDPYEAISKAVHYPVKKNKLLFFREKRTSRILPMGYHYQEGSHSYSSLDPESVKILINSECDRHYYVVDDLEQVQNSLVIEDIIAQLDQGYEELSFHSIPKESIEEVSFPRFENGDFGGAGATGSWEDSNESDVESEKEISQLSDSDRVHVSDTSEPSESTSGIVFEEEVIYEEDPVEPVRSYDTAPTIGYTPSSSSSYESPFTNDSSNSSDSGSGYDSSDSYDSSIDY